MSAGIYNPYVEQNTDWSVQVAVTDANGDAVNLTGATFLSQIRKKVTDPNPPLAIITCTLSATPVDGIFTMSMNKTITLALTAGRTDDDTKGQYVYDVVMTLNAVSTRLLEGTVQVSPAVSR